MGIQRVSNIASNGAAQNLDYDVSMLWKWLLDNKGGVMFSDMDTKSEFVFDKDTGILTAGSGIANAVILCTRPTSNPIANQTFLAQFQLFGTVTGLQTTNGTKVYIEIKENLINDPSLIEDPSGSSDFAKGFNIGEIKATAAYPTHSNYIKLWEINGSGVLVDMREGISIPYVDEQISAIQDQLDAHEGRLDTAESALINHENRIATIETSISSINAGLIAGEALTPNVPLSLNGADGKVYVAKANSVGRNNFIGFCNGTFSLGQVVSINQSFCSGLSSLVVGSIYFLSDTLGQISTTPGTNRIMVGQAVSTTKILIDKVARSIIAGTAYTAVSLPTARTTSGQTWVKVKEAKIPKTGTYTVSFDLVNSASAVNAHGRIYKNGVALGTDRAQGSSVSTKTESFSFMEGDIVQLYIYQVLAGGYVTTVSNFNIKYALQEDLYVCSDTID